MASEDLFEHEYSEEIITQLDSEFADNIEDRNEEESAEPEIYQNDQEQAITEDTDELSEIVQQCGSANLPTTSEQESKLFHLPLTRIRNLMKLDPDLNIASNEAVFAITRATELFIESLARESYTYTAQSKKKTVQKRDVDLAISAVDSLMFLDGAMNF